jgi:hypothetical protein
LPPAKLFKPRRGKMRKLKGPLPTVEKGQQKHFLLAMQVL